MGVLRQALARWEIRAFGSEAAKIPPPGAEFSSWAGPAVTQETALAHIDVYKNVSLIADAIAMLPLRAFRQSGWVDSAGFPRLYAQKVPRQPLLLTDPLPGDLAPEFSFKHRVMTSLLLDGNTYNEAAAVDETGFPSVVVPIDPSKVRDVRLNRAGLVEYVMHDGGIMGHIRDGGTMVHWPGFIRPGSLRGISPIRAGMQGIALSMAAEKFGARWFGDGANPAGLLKHPDPDLTRDEARKIKREWVRSFSGLSREPAIIYGGMEWTPLTVPPEESQFIETRRFQAQQIAGLYRVPPHLVGNPEATSWGTGIEEQGIGFVVFTLGPWLSRMEQAMSFLLPRGQFARFNVGALLRGRTAERYAAYAVARQWGWLSVNDIRELEDLPPLPDGDVYLQPLNMIDAANALDLLMKNKTPTGGTP